MRDTAVSQQVALAAGYRHFDLAERYTTQAEVGRALAASGVPRNELFLVNKLDGLPVGSYATVRARVERMLAAVGVASFDLLLVHYPAPAGTDLGGDPSTLATPAAWAWFQQHVAEAWAHMSQLRADGLCTEVGVSNCYETHLLAIEDVRHHEQKNEGPSISALASSGPAPSPLAPVFAAEVFVDAAHPEVALVAFCRRHGVQCLAYRPLAFLPVLAFLEDSEGPGAVEAQLEAAAEACTGCDGGLRQLVLASLHRRGLSPIASSTNAAHVRSNFAAASLPCAQPPPPHHGGSEDDGDGHPVGAAEGGFDGRGFAALRAQAEAVDTMGGCDEYAAAFKQMGAFARGGEPKELSTIKYKHKEQNMATT
jgi:diketogulonate reductase-like aldo/keto reductase